MVDLAIGIITIAIFVAIWADVTIKNNKRNP